MAQATTLNTVGQREDLTDLISNLAPQDTPILSAIGTATATAMLHEWQVDTLKTPTFAPKTEGADVTVFENKTADRARIGNRVQTFQEPYSVTRQIEAVSVAGAGTEWAKAKIKAAKEIKLGLEAAIGSDTEMTGAIGAPAFRGLGKWIQNGAQAEAPVPAIYRTPTGSINTTPTRELDEEDVNTVLQSVYEASGSGVFTLYAGSELKRAISAFARANRGSSVIQVKDDASLSAKVDFYDSDFGKVAIVPDHFLARTTGTGMTDVGRGRGYLLRDGSVKIAYLGSAGKITAEEFPDLGGGKRGMISAMATLVVENPIGLGKFAPATLVTP